MLLAIETSSLVSSVALLHEDTLRAELTIQARLTHSEQLMPHIADMLAKASVTKSQIDGVAVSIGPGSFTGLRIGLATAKGLSFAWNVPIVGVTTPISLAYNFVGTSDRVCTLIDAQKGNVYAGVYRWSRTKLVTEKDIYIAPLTDVLDTLEGEGQPVVFCGDGSLEGPGENRRPDRPFPHGTADDGHSPCRKRSPRGQTFALPPVITTTA